MNIKASEVYDATADTIMLERLNKTFELVTVLTMNCDMKTFEMLMKCFKTTAVGDISSPAIDETRVQMIREYLGKPFDQITMMELVYQISEMPEKIKEMLALISTSTVAQEIFKQKLSSAVEKQKIKDMESATAQVIEQKLNDLSVGTSE